MKSFVYQCLFVIAIGIKFAYQLPNGAPPSACGDMMPQHNVKAQACPASYTIQSDKTQYYSNDTVNITVKGATSSDTFQGMLLIAKTATSSQIIGSWTVSDSNFKTLACNSVANTGVTHTSSADKTSATAIWTPPSSASSENTVIGVTIVKTFDTIYVGCFSVALTSIQNVQSSTGAMASTTSAGAGVSSTLSSSTTTTVSPTSDVDANIAWTYNNGVTSVKMKITKLQTSQWLAIGLSLDQSMGNDHVFVCKRLSNDTVMAERRVNPGGHNYPVPASTISNAGATFNVTSAKLVDGTVSCEFTLSNFGGSKRRRRDTVTTLSSSTSYYPLIAIGNLDPSNQLMQHMSRRALSQMVQLNQQETINYSVDSSDTQNVKLAKAHGIIMIFAWILFASTGILSARYFKPVLPDEKPCGKAVWFVIHRPVMISVVVLTLIAFGLILIFNQGTWVPKSDSKEFAHSIIGIIVISFAVIQPFMAIFRCKPDAEFRFIFNYAHRFLGLSALLLSIIAIFIAVFFDSFNLKNNGAWGILIVWICWIIAMFIIFWFIDYFFQSKVTLEKPTDSYDLGNSAATLDEANRAHYKILQDRIKLGLLVVHILVAFGLALALAILVGNA